MRKLLAFCCCISALAAPALAQPAEYELKLTPADAAELGKGLADRVRDAQGLLALVQKLQQQIDAQNRAAVVPPTGESKP